MKIQLVMLKLKIVAYNFSPNKQIDRHELITQYLQLLNKLKSDELKLENVKNSGSVAIKFKNDYIKSAKIEINRLTGKRLLPI